MNHYPKHVGDFITATVGLSLTELGAYTALLDQYYAQEGPILHAERYRLTRAISQHDQQAVDYVLGKFFRKEDDGWHQKRADQEIEIYKQKSAAASASAQVRWCKGNANAMRTHSDGNAKAMLAINQEPITKKKEQKPARKRATPLPEGFDISERVKVWAAEKGHQQLDRHLEAFLGKVAAKGYTYADWDAAFMNCIREDWGKVHAAPRLAVVPERHGSHVPARLPILESHTEMPAHAKAALDAFLHKVKVG